MPPSKLPLLQRILKIEPGISLGQWAFDKVIGNWERVSALFVAGGGMSYLAFITEAVRPWGPLGIGAVGMLSALTAWIGLGAAQNFRGKAALRRAESAALTKWQERVDTTNPLSPEFHTKRIGWLDIAHPISRRIENKRFIDCEILGPANIVLVRDVQLDSVTFIDCDFVVVKPKAFVSNVVALENVKVIGGSIWRTTILLPAEAVPMVKPFAKFITKTGDAEIDGGSPLGPNPAGPPLLR